jgi:hypothetical protein
MNHRDAFISDITIVLKPNFGAIIKDVIEQLNEIGVGITNVNEDVGAVEGSIDSGKVHMIEKLVFVDAVRTTFTYVADYPPGDPRDQDGPEME